MIAWLNKKFKPDQQNKIKQKTYLNLSNTIPENLRDKQNKKISGAEVWRVKSRDRIIYHGCTGPKPILQELPGKHDKE